MQEFYDITVAGVKRSLPVVPINENMSIAGFVIFGDTDVVEPCARALAEKLPPETEEEAENAQLVILSVGEDDEGEYLDVVDDDELLLELGKLFEERLSDEYDIEE